LPMTMIALMVALEAVPIAGATSLLAIGGFAVGAAALFMLGRVERKAGAPLVPLEVLRNREFLAANASCVLSFFAIGAVFFVVPFYLKGVLGFPEFKMGLALLPIPISIAVVGPLSGRLSDRIGSRIPCAAGLSIACGAAVSLSTLTASAGDLDLVWRFASFGAGMALFQAPNNSSAMGAVPRPLLGLASGFLSTMRSLGLAIGVATAALLLTAFYAAQTGGVPLPPGDVRPDAAAFVAAQSLTFLVIAAVAAAGVVTSLVRGDGSARPQRAPVTASSRGK
jgi:MFS family permease